MKKQTHPTILMTGATGFLGSAIVNTLCLLPSNKSYDIIVLKRSTSNTFRIEKNIKKVTTYNLDEVAVDDIFKKHSIDIILHCATDYGRKEVTPMQIIEANLVLPITLLELGRKYGISGFINTDTILDKRINHYSLSKSQFHDWLTRYKTEFVCANVQLAHFYGPGDDTTKFVSFIVREFLEKKKNIDLTKGEQIRDFTYIDDVVDAFVKIINHIHSLHKGLYEFEVCSGYEISIKDLVYTIQGYTKNTTTKLNFGAIPYRDNEVMQFTADSSKIRALGWKPKFSINKGLKMMITKERNHITL